MNPLTPMQTEVYKLLAEGKSHKEVAEVLFLSRRTIEGYTLDAHARLGVNNRVQALNLLRAKGVI